MEWTAVCQACGWEGPEEEIELKGDDGDTCPSCNQEAIEYFSPVGDDE